MRGGTQGRPLLLELRDRADSLLDEEAVVLDPSRRAVCSTDHLVPVKTKSRTPHEVEDADHDQGQDDEANDSDTPYAFCKHVFLLLLTRTYPRSTASTRGSGLPPARSARLDAAG